MQKLLNALVTRLPSCVAETIMNTPALLKQVTYKLLQALDEDCTKLCAKKTGSILQENSYPNMSTFEWDALFREMTDHCQFLRDVLVTTAKCANKHRNHIPPICLCFGILLQQCNCNLSLVQRINTVLLAEGNGKCACAGYVKAILIGNIHHLYKAGVSTILTFF